MKNKNSQANILAQSIYQAIEEAKGKKTEQVVDNFLVYLREHHLLNLLPLILAELKNIRNQELGIVSVKVKSAHDLSKETMKDLEKFIFKRLDKKVELEIEEEKSLLGGVVLSFQDKQIDLSLKNRLNHLFKKLSN
ncbi:ATP synthase F1 subunit delta [Candidatus Nomurabacteria bacterium]|nr:ATP synthase F1 subunit delta [Candidatus Nomurabacteria bacterium]